MGYVGKTATSPCRNDLKVHVRRMVWFVGVLLKPLLKKTRRDRRCKVGRQINCQCDEWCKGGLRTAARSSHIREEPISPNSDSSDRRSEWCRRSRIVSHSCRTDNDVAQTPLTRGAASQNVLTGACVTSVCLSSGGATAHCSVAYTTPVLRGEAKSWVGWRYSFINLYIGLI